MTALETVMAVLWVCFTIGNWIIYHKCFTTVYFDLRRGLLKEGIVCGIVGVVETAIVIRVFQWLAGAVGTAFLWVVRIIFWGAVIIFGICLLSFIVQAIKKPAQAKEKIVRLMNSKKKDEKLVYAEKNVLGENTAVRICPNCGKKSGKNSNFCDGCGTKMEIVTTSQKNQLANETGENEETAQDIAAIGGNREIKEYIALNFDQSSKVNAIKKYRELTGTGLKEAKDAVDRILEQK